MWSGRAAVHGGTTTIIDFTRASQGTNVQDAIEKREEDWKGHCACDYAQHIMVEGALPLDLPGQLAEAIQAGFPTVKIFTTDITPSRKGRMVDFGDIWEVFQVLKANDGLGVIHSEDNDIVMHMYGKLIREGRTGFANMAEVHNTLSEDISFRRVIRLAEKVGATLYMMHTSAASGVAAIREARARGVPIYGESLHQYMLYTSEDYKRPNGQIYHTYPSLKSAEDQAALWAGTLDGCINCVATDEICCTLAKKLQGVRIDDTTGGNAGVEPRVALMYTEMVGRRGYSLSRFVDLVSTNAARIMGLYPRKGALAAGSDADICVLDPADKRMIRAEDLHEADYTPWEGRKMDAWPCLTRAARQGRGGERHVAGRAGRRQVAASEGGAGNADGATVVMSWLDRSLHELPLPLREGVGEGAVPSPSPPPPPSRKGRGRTIGPNCARC